ncbi:MAG: glycosyltransferase family 2 protein, partial [Lachnospiraceae bacterium]|nr:glycosyltransferase family 2 protein [Lachnospiraceae bacterium]
AIENKSPDESLSKLKKLAGEAKFKTVIIEAGDNVGIAKGNNIGIEHAMVDGCDLILLANNDIEFVPEAIETLVESLDKYHCDMVVPKIFNYFTGKIWNAGGGYGYKYATYSFGSRKDDSPEYNKPKQVDFAPTCFMLIKSEVFEKTGLMDERYFVYYDDTDFVWRAVKQNGFKLYYEPGAVVWHKAGTASGSKASPFTFYMDARNRAYFMNKYFPWYQRWSINTYKFIYYFLYTIKHPDFPSIFKNIGYYREGLNLYREWLSKEKSE